MNKILVAVDDTKSSVRMVETMLKIFGGSLPERLTLLHVQKPEGGSVMDELLLSDSEMETLKTSLQGTEYQAMLDRRSARVIEYFKNLLADRGVHNLEALVREGHPAEEILRLAQEQDVEMIVIGSRSKRLHNLVLGSVSREVANKANTSVLLIK